MHLHDAAKDSAVGEHVVVVIVPLAGWAGSGGAFEDELIHLGAVPIGAEDRDYAERQKDRGKNISIPAQA